MNSKQRKQRKVRLAIENLESRHLMAIDVLVIGAVPVPGYQTDVIQKLNHTGVFNKVDSRVMEILY